MTLLEAMAYGKACAVTAVGGNPEIVKANETGLVTQSEDLQAFADALERLLLDETLRYEMGLRGRQRFEALFTLDKMVSAYLDIYR